MRWFARAVFGAPYKHPERVIEETLRDRALRKSLEEFATQTQRPVDSVVRVRTARYRPRR